MAEKMRYSNEVHGAKGLLLILLDFEIMSSQIYNRL